MMRYSFLLMVCACLVWNVSTAQRTTTPSTATELNKSRTDATANTDKPAASASGRSTITTPQSTSNAKTKPKTTLTATNTGASNTKKTTIPASTSRAGYQNNVKPVKPLTTAPPAVAIKWMSIEEAIEKSKTEKRKILVDVYTDWCGWCKHMDSTTFIDPTVVTYLNDKYYAVKFNAEQTQDIQYKDKVYKFKKTGARGFHELAALWLNNRLSYPTTVVLNEDQDLIQPIPGYQDAAKMDAIIHYFGTDSHKKTPWEKYEKNYVREQRR